ELDTGFNQLQFNGDVSFALYGLSVDADMDLNVKKVGDTVELAQDTLKVIGEREFIAYYFGLVTVDIVKFTSDEFDVIKDAILLERVNLNKEERKALLDGLNRE